jgi:outer membrane cobalamin receptor
VRPPATYGLRPFAVDEHLDVYSAGAEWQFHPVARLGAVLGTAVNWQDRVDAAGEVEPTWIAGVTYDATQSVRLHVSATRKIRFPSIDQLYNASSGNTGLVPEHAYGVDAGVSRTWRNATRVGVSVFNTMTSNFIERDSGAPFTNRDRYRFTGVEGELDARPMTRLELRTAYTFLDAVNLTPGAAGAELQTRPRHRAMLEAGWQFSSRVNARGTVEGVADQKYYSRGATPVQARAKDYVLVGGRVAYQLSSQYEVMAGVTNLFDALYEQSYGLPREGRTAFLTLRARLR